MPVTARRAGKGGEQSETGVQHCRRGGMSAEMVRDTYFYITQSLEYLVFDVNDLRTNEAIFFNESIHKVSDLFRVSAD